jgi:hypothetical protein
MAIVEYNAGIIAMEHALVIPGPVAKLQGIARCDHDADMK